MCSLPKLLLSIFLFISSTISAQIIDYNTIIRIEGDKKVTEKKYTIQINNKEENWLSKIEISHSPNQDFTLLDAFITNTDGTILRKLKRKEILTRSDLSTGSFYQDDLIEEFEMYWNQYPYYITYRYRLKEPEFLFIARWFPLKYFSVPVHNSKLKIELPVDYPVSMDFSDDFKFSSRVHEKKKILTWSLEYYKFSQSDVFPPEIEELIPNVTVVPIKFNYGVEGKSDTWTSIGSWMNRLNENTDDLPLSEQLIVDKLIDGIEDKREVIKTLYYYMQDHTTYVNVAIDVGGLKSYPAEYVCQNKYGDCKALTTYMKALLKHASISSFYTLAKAGKSQIALNEDLPSQQFNHVILAVPLQTDTIWLENTSNYLPFNYLGTFTQKRPVLLIKEAGGMLVKTPAMTDNDVLEKRKFLYKKDSLGWHCESVLRLKGEKFEQYRNLIVNESKDELEKYLISSMDEDEFYLKQMKILDYDRDSKNVTFNLKSKCQSPIEKIGNLKVIKPLKLQVPLFEDPDKRILKVLIPFPIHQSDSIIFKLNQEEISECEVPKNIRFSSEYGSYSATYEFADSSLLVTEKLLISSGKYAIEEYHEFHEFISTIKNHQKSSVVILK